jgi:hypothetical protein
MLSAGGQNICSQGCDCSQEGCPNIRIYAQNDGAYGMIDTKKHVFAIYDPEQDKVRTLFSPREANPRKSMQAHIQEKIKGGSWKEVEFG